MVNARRTEEQIVDPMEPIWVHEKSRFSKWSNPEIRNIASNSKQRFQNRKPKCTSVWLKNLAGTARNKKEMKTFYSANFTALYNSPTQKGQDSATIIKLNLNILNWIPSSPHLSQSGGGNNTRARLSTGNLKESAMITWFLTFLFFS